MKMKSTDTKGTKHRKGKSVKAEAANVGTRRAIGTVQALLEPLLKKRPLQMARHPHIKIPVSVRPQLAMWARREGVRYITRVIEGTDQVRVWRVANEEESKN